ncbi:hypothetical protein SK803_19730 [Lentzea sp. BCCO 10_0856]|uniref:Tissue inhibitor of metalloproteinase n=1 Tax=Lentzea miocenica TaxID=3095431 RepID=A0ABU4T2R7_9PSEU|nr:hypothetical protein [Lentzea sp. BCCO 10_0856]MDX8032449.1 hypothetical protein [Lentzea sp. BCCO 10_0856]
MTRTVGLFFAAALIAGMTAVFTGTAHACSCVPATEEQAFARADHVFQGRILAKSDEPDQKVRYRVVVSKERKGDVPRYVSVITEMSSASCGAKLVVGKDYLVFATGDASDRKVETSLCGGTRRVDRERACGN